MPIEEDGGSRLGTFDLTRQRGRGAGQIDRLQPLHPDLSKQVPGGRERVTEGLPRFREPKG